MTDYADYQTPQAHATAIAATGVPLLNAPAPLIDVGTVSVPAGGTHTYTTVDITQIGYSGWIQVGYATTPTVPFCVVEMLWEDSATGIVLDSDTFVCAGSLTPELWTTKGRGRCKADTLSVRVQNLDPAVAASVNVIMVQDSIVRPKDEFSWINYINVGSTVPTFTLPTLVDDESVLGILSGVSIPASGSVTYLFGMYDGLCNVGVEVTTGALTALDIRIRPKPDTEYSTGNILGSWTDPSPNFQFQGCRAPLGVVIANSTTVAVVINLSITRQPGS